MLSSTDLCFAVLYKNIDGKKFYFKHEISTQNVENVENTVKLSVLQRLNMWITWGIYVENVENIKNMIKMMVFSPSHTLINIFQNYRSIVKLYVDIQ